MIISWSCARCKKYVKGGDVGNCPHCSDYRTKNKAPNFFMRSPTGIAQRTDIEMNEMDMGDSIQHFQNQELEATKKSYKDFLKNKLSPKKEKIEIRN